MHRSTRATSAGPFASTVRTVSTLNVPLPRGRRARHQTSGCGRLGDPAVRIGPDGGAVLADGQVEGVIGQTDVLGVAMDQREVEVVLVLEAARVFSCSVLLTDAPGEPGAEVGGLLQIRGRPSRSTTSIPAISAGSAWS